ncbi:hypothetical protein N9X25_01495 [Verrucomicrobiales bacterium]|nr:hypothetical protein [Verrucomicrobiales bacterium]
MNVIDIDGVSDHSENECRLWHAESGMLCPEPRRRFFATDARSGFGFRRRPTLLGVISTQSRFSLVRKFLHRKLLVSRLCRHREGLLKVADVPRTGHGATLNLDHAGRIIGSSRWKTDASEPRINLPLE